MSAHRKKLVIALCVILGILLTGFAVYTVSWYVFFNETRSDARRYQEMYTLELDSTPVVSNSENPSSTPITTPEPTPFVPFNMAVAADETIAPKGTANEDTVVSALSTPPPTQDSFSQLLQTNPDTVGFLQFADRISLPVVQKSCDNVYYLDHNFENEISDSGCLFMDGYNSIYPTDDCLIVYGHNMHNGTMFGKLSLYGRKHAFRSIGIVRFDTIYKDCSYIPFAAFTASTDPSKDNYFELRQFLFEQTEFKNYVATLKRLSNVRTSIDVKYGDRLLLLVTCDSYTEDGRFVLALRKVRDNEDEDELIQTLQKATLNN